MRLLLVSVAVFGVLTCTQPMICHWIGREYLMGTGTLCFICATLFINLSRSTVDQFLNAYGLFSDVWAPIVEATLNIGLSITLGIFFGINGILCGVLISLIVIILGWKPLFLFRRGLHRPLRLFWRDAAIHGCAALVTGYFVWRLAGAVFPDPFVGWMELIVYAVCITLVYAATLSVVLCALHTGLLRFFHRMSGMRR